MLSKRLTVLLLAVFIAILPAAGEIRTKTAEKKDTTVAKKTPPKKKTPYETLSKGFTASARSGFLSIHKTNKDKIYLELPKSLSGRRILAGGTVSAVSDPAALNVGYKYTDPLYLQVEIRDTLVLLLNPTPGATSADPGMETALRRNYIPKVYKRLPVAAFSPDSSTVFIDATSVVNALVPKGSGFRAAKGDDKSTYFGQIKAFEDNASITVHQNFETTRSFLGLAMVTGSGTMASTISFLLLPQERMKPRIQDSRIGVFPTSARYDLDTGKDGFDTYRIATRWRIEPTDTAAWKAGQKVTVKKPIVWYVDDSFPKEWMGPIRQGVLAWNAAFEKIGLKDVLQVRDFPSKEEDPEFDPDNLKYSCLRYIPNATMNAMGPSWVDPVTGEILNASVLVYNDVIRLINNWRFVQTAQADERVRQKKLPQDVIDESLVYVISHEIGHTLGLMHNMGASAAIPVDSLRSPSFTAVHGTTPSIMDYARFNYVVQPGDKGVKLTPPALGVYDAYLIDWLYSPVPEARDMYEEAAIAARKIDARAGDPFYRYGAQQIAENGYGTYDPSSRTEDLGDDPIRASDLGVSNLKYILPHLNDWVDDDPDRKHRQQLYTQLGNQYYRYIGHVLAQVGGIRLYQVKDGTPGDPVSVVDKDSQRAALKWTLDQIRNSAWLNDPAVTSRFGLRTPASNQIAWQVAGALAAEVPERVMLASVNAGKAAAYTVKDYFDDLFKEAFEPSGKLTSEEKTLQRQLIFLVAKPLIAAWNKTSLTEDYPVSCEITGDDGFRCGELTAFGEGEAPYQRSVNITQIDETTSYRERFMEKVMKLAGRRRHGGPAQDKAHYEYLYRTARAAMGE